MPILKEFQRGRGDEPILMPIIRKFSKERKGTYEGWSPYLKKI
jgi:hypothetical protein